MLRLRQTVILLLLLLPVSVLVAQDSALYQWNVTSQKKGEGVYTLHFSTDGKAGYQLYSPGQELGGLPAVTLEFQDTAIKAEPVTLEKGTEIKFSSSIFDGAEVAVTGDASVWVTTVTIHGPVPAQLQGTLSYFYGKADEFSPDPPLAFTVDLEGGVKADSIKVNAIDIHHPVAPCGDDGTAGKSLLTIFLLGLGGGLIALLTPCVFPMIPVTVTFFTKKSGDRKKGAFNAILYGFFIFLIYVLITVPFHVAGNAISPEIFNNISTNVWLNLLFFAIFVAFALSFFGLFEIGLPSGLANKADAKSGLGNIGGIFFMATTLAIVSFSCTGPLLGTLLVGVADQGAWPLTIGAAGFGIALGLPFALFAMFPNWLQSLPKSGGWMTDVKVVLGFLELALAVKFLSNADLVEQWGLLKRETFIGLWVVIGLLITLFLLGRIRIAHSTPVKKFGLLRIFFILLFGGFTVYLLPGLTNSKWGELKMISGFPPPRTYSYYHTKQKLFEPIHNDYNKALQLAREQNKPVLIDFTGWACVNCRRMEEKVWPDTRVDSLMRHEFIVVSLYVDERNKLPLIQQSAYTMPNGESKPIITVGDKWATFQTVNFGATSQPQYAILSPDHRALTKTKYYTPNPDEFVEWLECGLKTFRENRE